MAKKPQPGKEKPKVKPRATRLEAERKRAAIIQDLIAGLSMPVVAERNNVSVSYISKVQKQCEDEIRAAHAVSLEARQEQINAFIEKTHDDIMEICQAASEQLKAALKAHTENVLKNEMTPVEIRQKKDRKIVIAVPANDLGRAVKVWKDIFSTWGKLQKVDSGAEEDEE